MNQFVVGALDEDGVMHALVGRVEMRAFDLPDHKVFIQNRAVDVEDAVVLPIKFKRSPLCPMAVTGGMSCTWNTSFASPLLPGVKAMYEPESSVPKPVTPLWSIRGLTTQNWVSLRMRPDTSALSWAVTSTPFGRRAV